MINSSGFPTDRRVAVLLQQIYAALGKTTDIAATSPTDEATLLSIAKGILGKPVSGSDSVTITLPEIMALDTILHKANSWNLIFDNYQWSWRSRGNESDTGRLDIGYVKLAKSLQLVVAGGGATNGASKKVIIKEKGTNTVLVTKNLSDLTATDSNDLRLSTLIDTTAHAGKTAYLSFEDNDTGGSWAWIGFNPAVVLIYDLTT